MSVLQKSFCYCSCKTVLHDNGQEFSSFSKEHQSSFWKKHSTDFWLCYLNDRIFKGFDKSMITCIILMICRRPFIMLKVIILDPNNVKVVTNMKASNWFWLFYNLWVCKVRQSFPHERRLGARNASCRFWLLNNLKFFLLFWMTTLMSVQWTWKV